MGLREYERKRDFSLTPEPSGRSKKKKASSRTKLSFVVQKHAATRLHYDFRLELDGVLLSWAVPKGPSLDPSDKRLAVHVEDHPLEYGGFEGTIPKGQYGGGSVIVWDRGWWEPEKEPRVGMQRGMLEFSLHGQKLHGSWALVRLHGRENDEKNWLLFKRSDEHARKGSSITEEEPQSAKTGRRIEDIGPRSKVWNSNRGEEAKPRKSPGRGKSVSKKATRRTAKPLSKKKPASKKKFSKARATSGRAPSRSRRAKTPALDARRPAKRKRANASPRSIAASLERARPSSLPEFVEPQLATLESSAPVGDAWLHEVKFDGYRMEARLEQGRVTWISRNGLDWTSRFESLSPAIASLPAKSALLDGEVVVLGDDGVSHFQDLQQALGDGEARAFTYFAFDLIHVDGLDLRRCALIDRKRVLQALLARVKSKSLVRYSDHIVGGGSEFLVEACRAKLEGIVSKRADGGYVSRRTRDWVKAKCGLRQEFVVAGFTQPSGSRVGFGSLVLGVHDKKKFVHAGRVGTGFDRGLLVKLRKKLDALAIDRPPFDVPVDASARRGVTWVKPRLVVEVAFTGWTSEGSLRHPSFEGLREDKPAAKVVKEIARSRLRGAAHDTRATARKRPTGTPSPRARSRRNP